MTSSATRVWEGMTIPAPGTYLLDPAHKRIGFLARHMMVSPVRGEFAEGTAKITVAEDPLDSWVTATIQAASVTTGNSDRDAHLRSPDFLDVERYPTLEYRSTGIKWQAKDDPIFYWARPPGPPAAGGCPDDRAGGCVAGPRRRSDRLWPAI